MLDEVQALNNVSAFYHCLDWEEKLFIVTITVIHIMTVLLLLLPTPSVISSKEKQNVLERSV